MPQLPEELPLSEADKNALQDGQGLLEVVAGRNDKVFVDGKPRGEAPIRLRLPVGRHRIKRDMPLLVLADDHCFTLIAKSYGNG